MNSTQAIILYGALAGAVFLFYPLFLTVKKVEPEAKAQVLGIYGPGKSGYMSAYPLSVLFGNLCCNTVYHYRHAGLGMKDRLRFFLPYTLSRPVSWVIWRNGLKNPRIRQTT